MPNIKAVIFDWGGVLINNPSPALNQYCAEKLGVSEDSFLQQFSLLEKLFQTGKISEKKFWEDICRTLNIDVPAVDSLWYEAFADAYIPYSQVWHQVSNLRSRGLKTAILSNTEKASVRFFEEQGYHCFDVKVFSCNVGYVKPDRKIFEITMEKLFLKSREALFFEDKPEYVDSARDFGIYAEVIQKPSDITYYLEKYSLI